MKKIAISLVIGSLFSIALSARVISRKLTIK